MPDNYNQNSREGLPASATQRLNAMRGDNGKKGLFTSDLSASEFLLVKEAGFDPLGLVVGSSIYHIGWQSPGLRQSVELDTLTAAMYNARQLAMTRMEEEASALGADGIVGVRLQVGRQEWGENLAEFIAVGTAIRTRDGRNLKTNSGRPFTSDLSGQDFWKLQQAGYRPLSLVMGSCVYHVAYQGVKQWFSQVGQNAEMPTYTQAIYEARELALGRMQWEAEQIGADGIIGASVNEQTWGWGSHIIEYFAIGTSIISISDTHVITKPGMVMPLIDTP